MHGLLHYIRTSLLLRGALVALLLGCVGMGVWGEWLIFCMIRTDIRQSMKEKMEASVPSEELVLIKISNTHPPKDFQFIEEGREFRYKGEMYDIVNQKNVQDSVYYYCIHDIGETKLYADFDRQIQNELSANPQHQKKHHELLKKLPEFYLLATHSIVLGFTCYTPKPAEAHPAWLDAPLTILVPPPEIA